jgi:sec-independent protein translocase protein TatA
MGPIGIPELIIVLVILLVIFGPKRLPGLGRSLGTGMREFKDSIGGDGKNDEEERPALKAAPAAPAATQSTVTPAAAPEPAPAEREDAPAPEPRA